MKFHNVHGTGVSLLENKTLATRSDTSFCNGVVFSDLPVKVNQKVCLELTTVQTWSGALRVGLTTQDPSKTSVSDLPRYALPNLAKKEGYLIQPINECFVDTGSHVTLYLSSQGQLQLFVDGLHKGACLQGVPTDRPVWLCLDIYGNTKSAKFVKPDEAPKEILARGPEAVQAYEEACTSGTRPMCRTRLMLVGQDGVGKTSLKKAMMGQSYNVNEESTEADGIDLSASCSFSTSNHAEWKMAVRGEFEKEAEGHTEVKKQLGIMGGAEGLEEEYYQALAENIAKELQQKGKQKTEAPKGKLGNRDAARMSLPGSRKSDRSASSHGDKPHYIPPEMVKEVPDRVVQLVQDLLDQTPPVSQTKPNQSKLKSPSTSSLSKVTPSPVVKDKDRKVVMNIWDFAGQPVFYTTHQVFLTCRAVYIFVFNLTHDLNSVHSTQQENPDGEMTTLDFMDFWMRSIYAHTSQNTSNTIDNTRLSPPIFVVGTHRNSLSTDPEQQEQMVEEKFEEIRNFCVNKPYAQHIVTPFVAVENSIENDSQVTALREHVEEIAGKEPYMGEQMPIHWLRFEQELANLVNDDFNHASFDQVKEIANNLGISSDKEVKIMLEFYHDLGVLVYFGGSGTMDNLLRNTVILNPQWLVEKFTRILVAKQTEDKWDMMKEKWRLFQEKGILEDALIDHLWVDVIDQKPVLLGLMEKFDLVCQRSPDLSLSQSNGGHKYLSYYVPSHLATCGDNKRLYAAYDSDVVFYINFCGFLPDDLFHRILTRTVRWTLGKSGKEPYSMFRHVARFYLDQEHDFVLQMAPRRCHRIKVVVMWVANDDDFSIDSQNKDNLRDRIPKPEVCAKLRNFLESSLFELKEMWIKRLYYTVCVACPCGRPCYSHDSPNCQEELCMHFLNLDECLSSRVVCCEHRRVKTNLFRKWFPEPFNADFSGQILPSIDMLETHGNIEKHNPNLPMWVKSAAKLLNGGEENQDWLALANLMGYKEAKIEKITDDLNPGLALLADWILTSGNTALSVDMLVGYLEKMDRDDIVEIIQQAKESIQDPPQVFISYQWDCQDEVKALRDRLEKVGLSCWMDIGQMGGGDQLNIKIDEGIRNSKVVLSCVSPKYVVSHHCNRELSLADLLAKPIIPVMFESVPWPPPGGMSLIFSQLVYIDMKGVGGHGGTGIHGDLNDKYQEIIQRVMNYASPDLTKYFDTETLISSKDSNIHHESSSLSSMESIDNSLNNNLEQASLRHPYPIPVTMATHQEYPTPQQVMVTKCGVCTIL
ncbi:uncharacterized protein [Argopecten irradians]|uniref:uncharacterized protein n=1 Tax=Argopecten irradians TaxID=31199 RepID=UPI003723B9BD